MKKFIAIGALAFVLFALVAPEQAFAKPGDNVKFTQDGYSYAVKVTKVTQTANGIEIEYKGLEESKIGYYFFIVASYKDGTTNDYTNHEAFIKKDTTYSIKMKTDRQPSEITLVTVSLGYKKEEAQESLLGPIAERILEVGSNLPDLENMCWAYTTLVSTFDKISKWKERLSFLKDGYNLYKDFEEYKDLKAQGKAGSAEIARRGLLNKNLDLVESIVGGNMNAIQGTLLQLAVDGVKRVVALLNTRYDYYSFLSDVGGDDDDLCKPPYEKYAPIGVQMLADGKSVDEVREVFTSLYALETGGKIDKISASKRAQNTAKTNERIIDFKQFNYKDALDIARVQETKNGICIWYTGKKTIKTVVFLARVRYNDGKTKDYYNTDRGITKGIPWYPKMKTDFPSSVNFVTIYMGATKAEAEKAAASDKPVQSPKLKIQNNTGADISIVEIKLSTGWAYLSAMTIAKNANREVTTSSVGTFDLRVRTAGSVPQSTIYIKKNVKIENGSNITVTFAAGDKYTQTRADYQEFIQARCRFSDPKGVWAVMDKHPSPDDLYRVWAQSYPNTSEGYFPYPRSGNTNDKDVIQAQCKFGNPKAVWDAIAKHKNANDLLKKWADSYFKK